MLEIKLSNNTILILFKILNGGIVSVGIEIKSYLHILVRYMRLILSCVFVTATATLLVSALLEPVYSATAVLRVASTAGGIMDWGANAIATRLMNTYVEIATSSPVLDELLRRVEVGEEPTITVEIIPETELLQITAEHRDPVIAQSMANTLASIMVEKSLELYTGDVPTAVSLLDEQLQLSKKDLDEAVDAYDEAMSESMQNDGETGNSSSQSTNLDVLAQVVSMRQNIYADLLQRYENARINETLRANAITIVEPAFLPQKPSRPKMALNGLLSLVGGLGAGILLAFVLESMDTTISDIEAVHSLSDLPVLCRIPDAPQERRIFFRRKSSKHKLVYPYADVFNGLQVRLLSTGNLTYPVKIIVTSPEPGTGKSMVAGNLGIALSKAGYRVILVDADLRRPRLHHFLNLSRSPGLSDLINREEFSSDFLQVTQFPNMKLLSAGMELQDYSKSLTPERIDRILQKIAVDQQWIIIDSPALLSVPEASLFCSMVDGVILISAIRHTEAKNFNHAIQILSEIKANVLGLVVNRVPPSQLAAYYYYKQPQVNKDGFPRKILRSIIHSLSKNRNYEPEKVHDPGSHDPGK